MAGLRWRRRRSFNSDGFPDNQFQPREVHLRFAVERRMEEKNQPHEDKIGAINRIAVGFAAIEGSEAEETSMSKPRISGWRR